MVAPRVPRSAVLLSLVVVLLAVAASLATLVWDGSFPGSSGSARSRTSCTPTSSSRSARRSRPSTSSTFGAFACAIPALVMGAASIDVAELQEICGGRVPRRATAAFCLVFGALLALAWLKDIIGRSIAGMFGWPVGPDAVGHVVHALDLGLQVPLAIGAGVLLLRRRPAGHLVAAMMLVNSVCMGAALTAMVAWSSAASGARVWSAWPFGVACAS